MKSLATKIRDMSDTRIEQLLSSEDANKTLFTVTDDVSTDLEDIHILHRVTKQTKYQPTAEQGLRLPTSFSLSLSFACHLVLFGSFFFSILPLMNGWKTKVWCKNSAKTFVLIFILPPPDLLRV